MRVIAGLAKGHKLTAPPGMKTRPTTDRVKESLFSIISVKVKDARVLDLYAGSGALAIEALSRGADSALLVDSDHRAVISIERNLEKTDLAHKSQVRRAPAERALEDLAKDFQTFDLIFLDPPYRIEAAELGAVLAKLTRCLKDRGLVVLEHRSGLGPLDVGERLSLIDRREYGDTAISFLEKRDN